MQEILPEQKKTLRITFCHSLIEIKKLEKEFSPEINILKHQKLDPPPELTERIIDKIKFQKE